MTEMEPQTTPAELESRKRAQVEKRLALNREHARKSRQRKKVMIENLKQNVNVLKSENDQLKVQNDMLRQQIQAQGGTIMQGQQPGFVPVPREQLQSMAVRLSWFENNYGVMGIPSNPLAAQPTPIPSPLAVVAPEPVALIPQHVPLAPPLGQVPLALPVQAVSTPATADAAEAASAMEALSASFARAPPPDNGEVVTTE